MSKALSDEEIAQSVQEIKAEAHQISNDLLQGNKKASSTKINTSKL